MIIGKNCKISDKISVYNDDITIGDNVRIDDWCLLSGHISIGSHIHIAVGNYFYGGSGIVLGDFSQFGPKSTYLSESDDFFGESLVGPCTPMKYKPKYSRGQIIIGRHGLIGAHCVVLPGVAIREGASIGACSLVRDDCNPWSIYAGVPARFIRAREKKMLEYEKQFLEEYHGGRSA